MTRDKAVQITFFLLRVVAGWMFFQAGCVKMFGWFGGMPPGVPPIAPWSQIWIGALLEIVGGLLILLGLFTRPAAFILSGEMAVAYWQFHFGLFNTPPTGGWPVQNHGEPAVLYCFLYLFMAAYGAGDYSLDALIWRKRPA